MYRMIVLWDTKIPVDSLIEVLNTIEKSRVEECDECSGVI